MLFRSSPVSYVVLKEVTKDTKPIVIMGSQNDVLFGNGYVKGAFDMTSRYMAGDWRQYYFRMRLVLVLRHWPMGLLKQLSPLEKDWLQC